MQGPLVVAIGSKGPRFDPTFPDSTMFIGLAAKGHFVLFLVLVSLLLDLYFCVLFAYLMF